MMLGSIASASIGSAVLYEGLVVHMVVCFSFGISQFMEKMHVCLRASRWFGRYQIAFGEENGPCLLYGYDYGFVFGFLCLLLQSSGCCKRDSPQGLLF